MSQNVIDCGDSCLTCATQPDKQLVAALRSNNPKGLNARQLESFDKVLQYAGYIYEEYRNYPH
jgi:hypothetical protein